KFEREPFASASLGQVHRAELRTGEAVAVKVQYPGVANALDADLKNAGALVRALGVAGAVLDVKQYYDEMHRELSYELDYRREREAMEVFRGYLARWPDLVVPRTYAELSSARVLVMERLEGPTLHAWLQAVDTQSADERRAVG